MKRAKLAFAIVLAGAILLVSVDRITLYLWRKSVESHFKHIENNYLVVPVWAEEYLKSHDAILVIQRMYSDRPDDSTISLSHGRFLRPCGTSLWGNGNMTVSYIPPLLAWSFYLREYLRDDSKVTSAPLYYEDVLHLNINYSREDKKWHLGLYGVTMNCQIKNDVVLQEVVVSRREGT